MLWWQTLILGVVEGVTEFLPVSSTAHLILSSRLLGIAQSDFSVSFIIAIQAGAIVAVAIQYWRLVLYHRTIWRHIAVALLPTLIVGAALFSVIRGVWLKSDVVALAALFVGGWFLVVFERFFVASKTNKEPLTLSESLSRFTYSQSFGIGLAQAVAVVPGVSRAAATIVGGMVLGLSRQAAVEFSFLLAVPTIVAAVSLDLFRHSAVITSSNLTVLFFGFVVSFISAAAAVKFLLYFVKRHTLALFGWYRIAMATLLWFLFF